MSSTIRSRATLSFLLAATCAALAACASAPPAPVAPCTGECSSHDDGYQWAMRGTLDDARICDEQKASPEFIRGCKDAVNDFSQMRPASTGL